MSEYETGYMKPPRATRFKPGQSGNSAGRPRGSKNTYKLLDDILNQKVQITQDGKPVHINKKTAILLQAVNKAAKGDTKSFQTLFPYMLAVDAKNEQMDAVKQNISINGQELIDNFKKRCFIENTKEVIDV